MLICNDRTPFDFLMPGAAYLFKTPGKPRFARQVWSEVIAYRLGCTLGIDVPPCFVAIDETTGEVGALIEFFYDHRQFGFGTRLVHGAEYLRRVITDAKKGRPHALITNIRVCLALQLPDPVLWWARIILFDALIGNVDRHPDNWGIVFRGDEPAFAPAFDHGSSLAYELEEAKVLDLLRRPDGTPRYIAGGRHHCGWSFKDDVPVGHLELCLELARQSHAARGEMIAMLNFDRHQIDACLNQLLGFTVGEPLTEQRVRLLSDLIWARRTTLASALERRP
jgi:hypothetical protein